MNILLDCKKQNKSLHQEDPESETGYTLHSYMQLTDAKGNQLRENRSLF